MCGINGIISLNSDIHFESRVRLMNDALAHRGPDDSGIFSEPGIVLGHRRLSIIDLSPAGHQPMQYDRGRYTIVYNGELYNYREIRHRLGTSSFSTNSDTEVILAAYAKWGEACLDHFNGMFAFAIYDKEKKAAFIARDRMGIKPLYYLENNGHFVFSSEIRGIFASGFSAKKIDPEGLQDYLMYQTVHAPATIISDIKMLMPGNLININASSSEIKQWWAPVIRDEAVIPGKEDAEKKIRILLRDAVERRLVADVPFGAFLSGGIDSSIIVGLMKEVIAGPVNTFSVTFDDSEFSEAVYANRIAKKFKTIHHDIKLKPEDLLTGVPAALNAMDHPSGDGPNTYVVSEATRKAGITMALSGLGGDELFCGYDIFRRTVELEAKTWLNYIPVGIRSLAGNFIKRRSGVAGEKKAAILGLDEISFSTFYPISRRVLLDDDIRKILNRKIQGKNAVNEITDSIATRFPFSDHVLGRVSIAEMTTYMQNVLLRDTDQMSMAHALEVRVPFLDYNLVEYVLNLPDSYKFPDTPKKLLVNSCSDLLPPEIVNRPKMGFVFPWQKWMKAEMKDFCGAKLKSLSERKQFDREGIMILWNRFLSDDPRITWSRIWPLVVLEHWMQKNGINE